MEANTRKLERIFDQTITYQVPLFQRPYVWTREKNWEPLWEDILALLDKHLNRGKAHPHFLGAVVLEQVANPTGSIESRQVIDGQQRFTTLQLFLMAARDHAVAHKQTKYVERFSDLVTNRRSKIDHDDEMFKVWPTNSNRESFKAVHEAGSPAAIDKQITLRPELCDGSNNIIEGYKYFYKQIEQWFNGLLDDKEDTQALSEKSLDDRFDSLWQVVKDCLQIVVIDLDQNDETQVIFETLNARGEDLLPADLIKNFLFRRAKANGDNVERLYADNWKLFETDWWRDEIRQGRITRPRVDVFINHYLTMMTRDEVKSSHIFNAFKAFARQSESSTDQVPKTAAEHIAYLSRYAEVFKKFYWSDNHPRLATFLRRLDAVDTTTVFPFLLYSYAELLPDNVAEFDAILELLEAYLVRRMICGMTSKNYNRYFVELIKALDKKGVITAAGVAEQLKRSSGDSTRFPDDIVLAAAITDLPLYDRLAQYKVRTILEALDAYAFNKKSEAEPLPNGLTIEHVMPQKWADNWPLCPSDKADPMIEQEAIQRRDKLLNTLGNLTLVTCSLNPALSNSAWVLKRPELLKFSKLNLTQYFHGEHAAQWGENEIETRTQYLIEQLKKIWPMPTVPVDEQAMTG
ncbi:DUF262 domain-containing protein [Enterobacteriaceae bacterium RIT691]|nr:DUF262 domain-containing protein [Enterobacteriaceae bacterium RIT691]